MSPTLTTVLMLGIAAAVIGVDVWLAVDKRGGNTYSEVIRKAAKRWIGLVVLLSFGLGLLCGHWFWSPREPCHEYEPILQRK